MYKNKQTTTKKTKSKPNRTVRITGCVKSTGGEELGGASLLLSLLSHH